MTPTFTKERLFQIASGSSVCNYLAAFALELMEGKEAAEAEREILRFDKFRLGQERGEEWIRAENAEAERDEARRELAEAEKVIRAATFADASGRPCWASRLGVVPVSEKFAPAVLRARERAK